MFHFTGEIIGGSLQLEENEIIDSKWITASDLLIPDLHELRGATVIKQIAENLINGENYSLSLYNPKLVK